MSEQRPVIVVAGGDDPPPSVVHRLPAGAPVVAADAGVDHALALGLDVTIAVGDFDSVSAAGLDRAEAAGARLARHPAAKDHTDLELALEEAVLLGATEIVVVGGHGGRLDHLLAGAMLLAAPRFGGTVLRAHWGPADVHVLHGGATATIDAPGGSLLTLVPVHGGALGVRTEGLRYPLQDEDLPAGTTRGVSNVVERSPAQVALRDGTLLVVVPGELDR